MKLRSTLAFVVLALVFSCAHMHPRVPELRSHDVEAELTLLLQVVCATDLFGNNDEFTNFDLERRYGSAVVIDGRHALTAEHVVDCRSGQRLIRGTLPDGHHMIMTVDREDHDHDIARVVVQADAGFGLLVPTPIVSTVRAGDTVCSSVAYPKRGWNCGAVRNVDPDIAIGDIRGWWRTVPGNSGSGLYRDGALVGIVVQHRWCGEPGKSEACGGNATGLFGIHDDWFTK